MEKTLESIFIKKYYDLQNELLLANEKIKILESKEHEEQCEKAEQPVFIKTISKEVCHLTYDDCYYIKKSKQYENMTSEDIAKILKDEQALKKFAQQGNDYHYNRDKFVNVDTRVFPYTANLQGDTLVLMDISYDKEDVYSYVMKEFKEDSIKTHCYYSIEYKDKLYEWGLQQFKKELEKAYQQKVKEEEEK